MSNATLTNPESAQQALDRLKEQGRVSSHTSLDELKSAEVQEHVEVSEGPEQVAIDVGGEMIPCEPLGVGQRVRPQKKARKAQERGDDGLLLEANLDMIDALVDASPPAYDQAFWDALDGEPLQQAFLDLARGSAGGNGPTR